MKPTALLTLLAALTPTLTVGAAYTANFTTPGKLPKGMTTLNANVLRPLYTAYGAVFTEDGWTVDRFGNQFVVMTPTHTGSETACENILTLPELEIAEGESLIWSARSALADFPESYRVLVADGDDVTEIASVAEEDGGRWMTHVAPLSQFAGRKVTIKFVATSVNRFMLMLNAIKVAAPQKAEFFVTDTTPAYTGSDGAEVSIEALNTGMAVDGAEMVCRIGDDELRRIAVTGWTTGESRTFTFDAPAEFNHRSRYTVTLEKDGATLAEIASGSYFSSFYPRTLVVDEGTGMWCVNCPAGLLQIQKLQRKFGEQVIPLATHTNDVLANNGYFSRLGMHSIPNLILNRVPASMGPNDSNFEFLYDRPTPFDIQVWETAVDGDKADVTVAVRNAEGIDNASGRYRIGYVLTSTFYHPGEKIWDQSNGCTTAPNEQFYLLPGEIPSDLIKYHHTTFSSDNAFDGIAESLPARLDAGEYYSCSWTIENPNDKLLTSLRDGEVVAYVIDTEDGHIENAVRVSLEKDMTGIDGTVADRDREAGVSVKAFGNTLLITPAAGDTDCGIAVYDTAGRLLLSQRRLLDAPTSLETGLAPGVYIIKADTPAGSATLKTAIR